MQAENKSKDKFTTYHLGIIRVFAIWGILDSLIYLLAKDNRLRSITIYVVIFVCLTIYGLSYPDALEFD
jgi:hypothetical protein